MMETFIPTGDNPFPRFGHTVTQISQTKSVLFGGAIGNTGQYSITGNQSYHIIWSSFLSSL